MGGMKLFFGGGRGEWVGEGKILIKKNFQLRPTAIVERLEANWDALINFKEDNHEISI